MVLSNKNIILTGAASGIGGALLAQLQKINCQILAVDISYTAITVENNITFYPCDLSQADEVTDLFAFAVKKWDKIDVFIANAGFAYFGLSEKFDWQQTEKIFAVNALSPISAAITLKRLNVDSPFTMAIVASAMAHWPLPGYALYSSTKAAVHAFAQAFRHDLLPHQRLVLIYPIGTRTAFFDHADSSPIPLITQSAEKVAREIIRGISSKKNEVYPSKLFYALLQINRILPFIKPLVIWIEKRNYRQWLTAKCNKSLKSSATSSKS